MPENNSVPATPPLKGPLCTKEEAAAALAINKRTLDRLIAAGKFPPPLKLGRASRFSHADIAGFLERLNLERAEKIVSPQTKPAPRAQRPTAKFHQ